MAELWEESARAATQGQEVSADGSGEPRLIPEGSESRPYLSLPVPDG